MGTAYRSGDATTIWERDEPGRRGPVDPLRRNDVVRAALDLADSDGLTAVSVRRVAAAMDVGPMRLYRVFDTVDELVELMLDAVYGEIVDAIELRGTWRTRTRTILTRAREVILEHEWVADVIGLRPQLGPNGLAWLEMLASTLRRAPGVTTVDSTWTAMGVVSGFLVGAVRREVADRRSGRVGAGRTSWQRRMGPYLSRMLETGRYPALGEIVVGRAQGDADAAFRAELEVVLGGLNSFAAS